MQGGSSTTNPGDFAQDFFLSSKLDNKNISFSQRDSNNGSNFIFLNINASDYFIMNFFNSNKSIDEFLQHANSGTVEMKTTFIFYSNEPSLLKHVRDKIMARILILLRLENDTTEKLYDLKNAFFFADSGVPDYFMNILNSKGWNSKQRYISSSSTGDNAANPFRVSRLDGEYEWSVWPCSDSATSTSCASGVLVDGGKICTISPNTNKDTFVLVHLDSSCDMEKLIQDGMQQGVQGIIFVQELGKDVIELNEDNTNVSEVSIILSMISYFDGKKIGSNLIPSSSINISFMEPRVNPGKYFGIDSFGKLSMIGWEKFPVLMTLGWSSWKLNNDYHQYLKLHEIPSFSFSLFDNEPSGGSWSSDSGAAKNITMPSLPLSLNMLEIEFALSCIDTYDFNCGIWDRVISINICVHSSENKFCNLEISRYITAFRRGEGKWVTDITHLLPIFYAAQGKHCTFTIAGTPEIWYITASLRLSHVTADEAGGSVYETRKMLSNFIPIQTIPLFNGQYTFDNEYNNRSSINFVLPSSRIINSSDSDKTSDSITSNETFKILLSSVITGHGSDENGCGEFCSTTHHFYFNDSRGNTYEMVENFSLPTTHPQFGCANHGYQNGIAMTDRVNSGGDVALPNEHGTWTLGRNGWCNGQRVAPYKALLPSQFNFKGNKISVSYKGLYNGKTPNPKQSPGYMIVQSYVTIYKAKN